MNDTNKDQEIDVEGLEEGKIVGLETKFVVGDSTLDYLGKFKKFEHIKGRTKIVLTDCFGIVDRWAASYLKVNESTGKYEIDYPKDRKISERTLIDLDDIIGTNVYGNIKKKKENGQ